MMNTTKSALLALCCTLLVACGGGGPGDPTATGFTVESGVAQKGPLAIGSDIFINELSATTYQPNGKEYTFFTTNNYGNFSPSGITFGTSYLSTTALGYYFNEITGRQSVDMVNLRGLSQVGTGQDTVINVNTLSSMAVNRTLGLATAKTPLTFAAARAQAQKEVLGSFYIYNGTQILTGTKVNNIQQPANLTGLDLSQNRAADQILAAISGVVMQAGEMTPGTDGSSVNALLSMISLDLGDDGSLNNSPNYPQSVKTRLCAAAAQTNFATVATNLNSFYGTNYQASDLSQWVDTSGCVDQVINKYKFISTDSMVGGFSKSPAYVAGPDDVGQCFSVGGVTSGSTAGLYYKGGANPIVGTQKVALGDSMFIGLTASTSGNFTAYLQRSTPSGNGSCPGIVPNTLGVRVQKYTVLLNVTTIAGSGLQGNTDGAGLSATFNSPNGITIDIGGNLYVNDVGNKTIRKVSPLGVVSTPPLYFRGYSGFFPNPLNSITIDSNSNIYGTNIYYQGVIKINPDGFGNIFAGGGSLYAWGCADTNFGATTTFSFPAGVAVDNNGTVYVADQSCYKVRKITANGVTSTIAGTGVVGSTDGVGTIATFSGPSAITIDVQGNIYVIDGVKIRKITADGVVSTIAGTGVVGSTDGVGTIATFYYPRGIAVDSKGNLYIADTGNNKIRKITADGVVSTIAGTGVVGSTDGAGSVSNFSSPSSIAVDANGNIFITDTGNNKIRKITQ